jgi:hypothetical protein
MVALLIGVVLAVMVLTPAIVASMHRAKSDDNG